MNERKAAYPIGGRMVEGEFKIEKNTSTGLLRWMFKYKSGRSSGLHNYNQGLEENENFSTVADCMTDAEIRGMEWL